MNEYLEYVSINASYIWGLTIQHIELVGIAIIIAVIIGVSIGIYLTTNEDLAETVLAVASIMLTIPSIALFGIMIPIFSLINQGIGFVPSLVALVLYSQLPIIRNTYSAIKNVDPAVIDAANGVGMKRRQRLFRVEIPNALPVIMAGIRTAVVMNIGISVIAAFIGAGGLGTLIVQGITRTDMYSIVTGALVVSLLAIVADTMLLFVQKWMTPRGLAK